MSTPPAAPGWYPDPWSPGGHRYWDGRQWTQQTQPGAPGLAAAPKKGGAGRVVAIVAAGVLGLVVLLVVIGLLVGSDDNPGKFDDGDFSITFDYPEYLKERDDVQVALRGGNDAVAKKAFALDNTNLVLLQRYNVGRRIGKEELGFIRGQLEPLLEQLVGRDLSATEVEHGGLPGLRYDDVEVKTPPASSRMVFLFDGSAEYQFACQYHEDTRDRILRACDEMLSTLRRR